MSNYKEIKVGQDVEISGDSYFIRRQLGRGLHAKAFLGDAPDGKLVTVKQFTSYVAGGGIPRATLLGHRTRLAHPEIPIDVLPMPIRTEGNLVVKNHIHGETAPLVGSISLRGLRAQIADRVVRQVMPALSYLIHAGVVHRDIKEGNVVLRENEGSLIDLGLLTEIDGKRRGFQGELRTAAPEVLEGRLSRTSDVFSLGYLALEYLDQRAIDDLGIRGKDFDYETTRTARMDLRMTEDDRDRLRRIIDEYPREFKDMVARTIGFAIGALNPDPNERPQSWEDASSLMN